MFECVYAHSKSVGRKNPSKYLNLAVSLMNLSLKIRLVSIAITSCEYDKTIAVIPVYLA